MKQSIVDEYVEIIELTYQNYLNKPTWDKIQMLFQRFFYLGVEVGKQQAIQNMKIK